MRAQSWNPAHDHLFSKYWTVVGLKLAQREPSPSIDHWDGPLNGLAAKQQAAIKYASIISCFTYGKDNEKHEEADGRRDSDQHDKCRSTAGG